MLQICTEKIGTTFKENSIVAHSVQVLLLDFAQTSWCLHITHGHLLVALLPFRTTKNDKDEREEKLENR